jgi:hypothetical protein
MPEPRGASKRFLNPLQHARSDLTRFSGIV